MVLRIGQRFALAHLMLAVALANMTQTVLAQRNVETPPRGTPQPGSLHDVIVSTVFPETWDHVGGPSHIRIVDAWGVAIVTTTQAAHSQIEMLLSTIRQVRQQQDEQANVPEAITKVRLVESAANATARCRIEAALDSETTIDVLEVLLSDFLANLEQRHGIEIEIDLKALETVALTPDIPVTKRLSGVSLRSGLALLLRDIGLTYCIESEVLQVTTPDVAETRLITRVYPVKDLMVKLMLPERDGSWGAAPPR